MKLGRISWDPLLKSTLALALHLRRGVVENIPVLADYFRESDYVLKLDSETWAGLYLSAVSLKATNLKRDTFHSSII